MEKLRYIKLRKGGKRPIHKFSETTFTYAEAQDWVNSGEGDIAVIIEQPYIVIDVDDEDNGLKVLEIIEDLGIASKVYKTTRGYHFWFKSTKEHKITANISTPITVPIDVRAWGYKKNGDEKLSYTKISNDCEWREVVLDAPLDLLDELPVWLTPMKKRDDYDFLNKTEGERNSKLSKYVWSLQNMEYSVDDIKEIIQIINDYILAEPLDESEISTILRDETFIPEGNLTEKVTWFDEKDNFLHHEFGKHLIKTLNLVSMNESCYIYKNGVYVNTDLLVYKEMIKLYPSIKKFQRREVLDYISIVADVNKPEENPHVVNTLSGFVDLRTGKVEPHSPDRVSFRQIPVHYDTSITSFKPIDDVINKVFQGDDELIMLFYEILGYSISTSTRLHKSFFFTGEGSNGKSTVFDMMREFIGLNNIASLTITDLADKFKPAQLENKLVNIGDDISTITLKDTGKFKRLVSGEGEVVENKNQTPFTLYNKATMLFSANDLPTFSDKTKGMSRRIVILPFNATFSPNDEDFDPYILDKITTDEAKSYLLNRAIEGYKRIGFNGNRFTESTAVQRATDNYKVRSSTILSWAEDSHFLETLQENPNTETKVHYNNYTVWCKSNGYSKPIPSRTFTKELCDHYGVVSKQIRFDGNRISVFYMSKKKLEQLIKSVNKDKQIEVE